MVILFLSLVPTIELKHAAGTSQVVQALRSIEMPTALRAAEEVVATGNGGREAARAILSQISRALKDSPGIYSVSPRFMDALSTLGECATAELVQILKSKTLSNSEFVTFTCLLGRIDSQRNSSIPFLQAKLKAPGLSDELLTCVRMALATLGDNSDDNIGKIQSAFRAPNAHMYHALFLLSPNKWIDTTMIAKLTAGALDAPVKDGHQDVVLFLVSVNERAQFLLPKLIALSEKAIKEKSPLILPLLLARIRLDPKAANESLESLLSSWENLTRYNPKGVASVLACEVPYRLMDAPLSKQVALRLLDQRVLVRKSAAQILREAGWNGRAAMPIIIKILKDSQVEGDIRRNAAEVVCAICSSRDTREIESLLAKEESEAVRYVLRASLDKIKSFCERNE